MVVWSIRMSRQLKRAASTSSRRLSTTDQGTLVVVCSYLLDHWSPSVALGLDAKHYLYWLYLFLERANHRRLSWCMGSGNVLLSCSSVTYIHHNEYKNLLRSYHSRVHRSHHMVDRYRNLEYFDGVDCYLPYNGIRSRHKSM
jgi:hypothetical protein